MSSSGDESKSPFSIFAAYGGRAHALAEKRKRSRGQLDAFAGELPPPEVEIDERYTTRETLEWCKAHAGVDAFDLDAAACEESHHGEIWYGKAEDGLRLPWFGRVWCNPPYSDIAPWVAKARCEVDDPHGTAILVAMLVPATRTEQSWWQADVEPHRDNGRGLSTHFLPGRTAFARPGSGGVAQSGSPFGCVLLVWRRKRRKLSIVDVPEVPT